MKNILLSATAIALLAGAPAAADAGDWLVRLRAINVMPNEGADIDTIGGDVDIDSTIVPELDITYFVQDNWALELILATSEHDVTAIDTALGDVDLGDVNVLPPTLTLQYHFNPEGSVRPYAGVGVNYTVFFDEDLPSGSALSTIDYDASFGLAAQAGVDFDMGNDWFINVDAKYVDINTDVTIDGAISADVDIDPWILGVGLGRRF